MGCVDLWFAMDENEKSAMESAAHQGHWGAQAWLAMIEGSKSEARAGFDRLSKSFDPAVRATALDDGWALRFAHLTPEWRAFCSGLDEARLGELLAGNLISDDSGLSERYSEERVALRMLCVLRIFRESALGMGEPDPRINSLRRIKLGLWREYAQVGAPGISSSEAWWGGASEKIGEVVDAFSHRALSASNKNALRAWLASTLACGSALAWMGGSIAHSWIAGLGFFTIGASAFANAWVSSIFKRFWTKKTCEKILMGLGLPKSSVYESIARVGMLASARACEDAEAVEFLERVDLDSAWWNGMEGSLRRKINSQRAASSRESFERIETAMALDERGAIEKSLGDQPAVDGKDGLIKSSPRL